MDRLRAEKVLVVGSGSIGRRHIRNLYGLGFCNVAACDVDPGRIQPMIEELGVRPFSDFAMALAEYQPQIVFVCTPPIFHIPQARQALQAGAHVFIEKPLAPDIAGVAELIDEVQRRDRVVQVGYNLRFHPGLRTIKQLLDDKAIGRPLWMRVEVGQYLPDWRPWQDYRQSYTARQELGGGIMLDASHELDYTLWLLGQPTQLACMAGKVSELDVNVEDCATVLLRFANGAQADIHLDFVQRTYSRNCRIAGETGTIEWEFTSKTVRLVRPDAVETFPYDFEANQMYVDEIEYFLTCIDTGITTPANLNQAFQTLKVVLAARNAAQEVVTKL